MKNVVLILLVFIAFNIRGKAQTTVFDETSTLPNSTQIFGQNARHYLYQIASYGQLIPGVGDEFSIKPLGGWSFAYGLEYKYKLSKIFSGVFQLNYEEERFIFKKDEAYQFPESEKHDKQFFGLSKINSHLHFRVNVDQHRGNSLGKFIDVGGYFGYAITREHTSIDKKDQPEYLMNKIRTKASGLSYINPLSYGLSIRAGIQNYILFYNMRLSNLSLDLASLPDLPSHKLGILVALLN